MRFPAALVATALMTACVPDFHAVIGRACDLEHACPDSLFCVSGACALSVPEPVTVFSSNFEAGFTGWSASSGARVALVTTGAYAGLQALKVSTSETAAIPFGALTARDAMPIAPGRYCASAFVKHGIGNADLTLTLRSYGGAGATLVEASTPGAAALGSTKAYQAVKTELAIDERVTAVELTVSSSSPVHAEFFVDDVVVLRAFDTCP